MSESGFVLEYSIGASVMAALRWRLVLWLRARCYEGLTQTVGNNLILTLIRKC